VRLPGATGCSLQPSAMRPTTLARLFGLHAHGARHLARRGPRCVLARVREQRQVALLRVALDRAVPHGLLIQRLRTLPGNPVLPGRREPVEGSFLSIVLPAKPARVPHASAPRSEAAPCSAARGTWRCVPAPPAALVTYRTRPHRREPTARRSGPPSRRMRGWENL
jgi:hypothetical protein